MAGERVSRARRATFLPSTRRIYFHIIWIAIGVRVSWPSHPDGTASYAAPVRRARSLPTASFRFRLATDTLAVQLMAPAIRVRRGLSPQVIQPTTTVDRIAPERRCVPCLAHHKNAHPGWAGAGVMLGHNQPISSLRTGS
ncbi:hypothetical protein FEI13_03490 [Halomonas urmiana]|uniref:Uncharacterized protein n=1 Tax=Halomonas urmiana TaxID=490901 RepID=A0A5R8MKX2_9GAMM|nr:hypothetical protein FEI13_03490 [Halomonas urmiana]